MGFISFIHQHIISQETLDWKRKTCVCKWQTQREQSGQTDRSISHILAYKRAAFIWTQLELYLRTWQIPPFISNNEAFPSRLYSVSAVFQLLLFLGADSNCVHLEVDNTEQDRESLLPLGPVVICPLRLKKFFSTLILVCSFESLLLSS